MVKVAGKALKLDEKRMVWIARHPERADKCIVRFVNGEKKTEFIASDEALNALARLHAIIDAGPEWQQQEPAHALGE